MLASSCKNAEIPKRVIFGLYKDRSSGESQNPQNSVKTTHKKFEKSAFRTASKRPTMIVKAFMNFVSLWVFLRLYSRWWTFYRGQSQRRSFMIQAFINRCFRFFATRSMTNNGGGSDVLIWRKIKMRHSWSHVFMWQNDRFFENWSFRHIFFKYRNDSFIPKNSIFGHFYILPKCPRVPTKSP